VPTAPEKYTLPEETKSIITDDILSIAHKMNVSQDQLKELSDALVMKQRAKQVEIDSMATSLRTRNEESLKKEFGDRLNERMDEIKAVFQKHATEGTRDKLAAMGALHDVDVIKFLSKLASDQLRSTTIGADYAQRALTPGESRERSSQLLSDPKKYAALKNPTDPLHSQVKSEYSKILKGFI